MHSLAEWHDFYLAGAGAAAALAGLSIVAISANLDAILKTTELPTRAAAVIATLIVSLLVCMAGLMIGQGLAWFGGEVLVFSVFGWYLNLRAAAAVRRTGEGPSRSRTVVLSEIISGQGQTLPFLVGGVGLLFGWSWGLMWIGFGVLAVFGLSMITIWVLLIEIRR